MAGKLTVRQKAFADYFIQTGNATEAAKMAGYKNYKSIGVDANKTLKKPNVKAYVKERMEKIENKRIADAQEVLEYLTSVMRGEEKDQLGLDASLQDRTKAAELLGKRYKIFTEQIKLDGNIDVGVQIIDDIEEIEE